MRLAASEAAVPYLNRHLLTEVEEGQVLEMSPAERGMVQVSRELRGAMKVTNVVTLAGRVDPRQVRAAVAKLSHPVLRSFVYPGDMTLRVGKLAVETKEHEAVGDVESACEAIWASEIEKTPLEFGAPLARVDVVSGATDSAIMLTCEHAFCDAKSMSHLCHEVMHLLGGGEQLPPAMWSQPFEAACGGLNPMLLLEEKLKARIDTLKRYPPFDPAKVAHFPAVNEEKNCYELAHSSAVKFRRIVMSESNTLALVDRCRSEKVSLSGVLSAVVMLAAARSIPPAEEPKFVALTSAANTRRLYNPPMPDSVLGYHVSGLPAFGVKVNSAKFGIFEQAATYSAQMRGAVEAEYPLAMSGFMGIVWSALLHQTAKRPQLPMTCSFTSWGRTAVRSRYGGITVRNMFPLISMGFNTYPMLVSHTAADKLSVTVMTSQEIVAEADAAALARNVESLIGELIAGGGKEAANDKH